MSENEHCKQLLGSLSDYIDGALQEELCALIDQHLAECEDCRVVVNTLRKTVDLYRVSGEAGEPLPEDVRQRLFFHLNLEEYLKKE